MRAPRFDERQWRQIMSAVELKELQLTTNDPQRDQLRAIREKIAAQVEGGTADAASR